MESPPTMRTAPLVTYIRVSTSGQGHSGLGIEAQRHTLAQFAQTEGFEVAREFVEVEKGRGQTPWTAGLSSRRRWLPHGNSGAKSLSPSWTA